MRIVTSEEMRKAEKTAVREFGQSTLGMMDMAGKALAEAVLETAGAESEVLVMCGPGNNGGDGLAAARFLADSVGLVALLAVPPSELKGDALTQYRRLAEMDVPILSPDLPQYASLEFSRFQIVVDALLGTGSKGPLRGEILRLVESLDTDHLEVITADVPTGIDPDTGLAEGPYIESDLTVCFGFAKRFLFQNEGLQGIAEWRIADIGMPFEVIVEIGTATLMSPLDVGFLRPRGKDANKRTAGKVLVVAGSERYPGSAALCARGAMRAGAGLVQVASIREVLRAVSANLPEATLLPLPEKDGAIAAEAAGIIAEESKGFNAIVIGPGLGRSVGVGRMLQELWSDHEADWVVDADGLFWLSRHGRPKGNLTITPHEGEAGRLLGREPHEIARDRFGAAGELAEKYDAALVLKGPYSIAASAYDEEVYVCPTGNPGLATAGTGDVLAGMVAAVSAQGVPDVGSAAIAAYWHGFAADRLERDIGPQGYLATDIADELPAALAEIRDFLDDPFGRLDEEDLLSELEDMEEFDEAEEYEED